MDEQMDQDQEFLQQPFSLYNMGLNYVQGQEQMLNNAIDDGLNGQLQANYGFDVNAGAFVNPQDFVTETPGFYQVSSTSDPASFSSFPPVDSITNTQAPPSFSSISALSAVPDNPALTSITDNPAPTSVTVNPFQASVTANSIPTSVIANPVQASVTVNPSPTPVTANADLSSVTINPTPMSVIANQAPTSVIANPAPTSVIANPLQAPVTVNSVPTSVTPNPTLNSHPDIPPTIDTSAPTFNPSPVNENSITIPSNSSPTSIASDTTSNNNLASNSAPDSTTSTTGTSGPDDPGTGEESTEPLSKCLKNGCPNLAVDNPEWEGEYCSNECVVNHCKDVFNEWVAKQTHVAVTQG